MKTVFQYRVLSQLNAFASLRCYTELTSHTDNLKSINASHISLFLLHINAVGHLSFLGIHFIKDMSSKV